MAQFAVIGLGRFGSAASLELMRLGHQVIGIDSNSKFINRLADQLSHAVIADATDEPDNAAKPPQPSNVAEASPPRQCPIQA